MGAAERRLAHQPVDGVILGGGGVLGADRHRMRRERDVIRESGRIASDMSGRRRQGRGRRRRLFERSEADRRSLGR